jgi:TrmH family RNA methyltransferase
VRRSRFERRTPQDPLTRRDETVAFAADGSTWRRPAWFDQVVVVLVQPTDAVNIGGVARAMGNTGFTRLHLVNPVAFDPWHVIGVAHYAQHIVDATAVFDSLAAAVADAQLVLGMTGKHQRARRNVLHFDDALREVASRAQAAQTVAIVFGPEDTGLTNAMLDAAHAVTTIPTNPAYPSLNLAQAALLVLHRLFVDSGGGEQLIRPPRRVAPPAPAALLEDLFADLERALEAIEFFGGRSRVSIMRSLRVALTRAALDQREASLLRAVFIEVRRYLRWRGVLNEVGPVGREKSGAMTASPHGGQRAEPP